jgi:hypothetical protein
MNPKDLVAGMVITYPYLWFREGERGETEGRKSRPTAVAFKIGKALALMPITTNEPHHQDLAVEVPEIEKRRAGLDISIRQWIIFDELNIDDPTQSYYLEDGSIIGHFSKPFFHRVLNLLKQHVAQIKQVPRR